MRYALISNPMTRNPCLANETASGSPTYPRPTMAMVAFFVFMPVSYFLIYAHERLAEAFKYRQAAKKTVYGMYGVIRKPKTRNAIALQRRKERCGARFYKHGGGWGIVRQCKPLRDCLV